MPQAGFRPVGVAVIAAFPVSASQPWRFSQTCRNNSWRPASWANRFQEIVIALHAPDDSTLATTDSDDALKADRGR
jgi:hypothetical protein